MWEVARGLLLCGWFYYAIYAIGEHELRRVADAAVLHRYQQPAARRTEARTRRRAALAQPDEARGLAHPR